MSKISFELARLLGVDRRSRPNTLRKICKATGLKEYQVRPLLENKAKGVKFETLGKLVEFLVHERGFSHSRLLGKLFQWEPAGFLPLLRTRTRIDFCLGFRRIDADQEMVVAADAELESRLIRAVTDSEEEAASGKARVVRRPIDIRYAPSPGRVATLPEEVRDEAEAMFHDFEGDSDDRAFICLGSMKSNPLTELVVSSCFRGAVPFVSQNVSEPAERSCPFFLRYRDQDSQPPSCSAGRQLAKNWHPTEPGLYYAVDGKKWDYVAADETWDSALVFYRLMKQTGRLDVVLGGFSSQATRALADQFSRISAALWPPSYDGAKVLIGAYVVAFQRKKLPPVKPAGKGKSRAAAGQPTAADSEETALGELQFHSVVTLGEDVIRPRLPRKML